MQDLLEGAIEIIAASSSGHGLVGGEILPDPIRGRNALGIQMPRGPAQDARDGGFELSEDPIELVPVSRHEERRISLDEGARDQRIIGTSVAVVVEVFREHARGVPDLFLGSCGRGMDRHAEDAHPLREMTGEVEASFGRPGYLGSTEPAGGQKPGHDGSYKHACSPPGLRK